MITFQAVGFVIFGDPIFAGFLHRDFVAQPCNPCRSHFITHGNHWQDKGHEIAWTSHRWTVFYRVTAFTWCSDFKGWWCKRSLPFVSYVCSKMKHNRDKTNKSFANPALTHHHLLSCFVCAICTRPHNPHVQPFSGAKPQRVQYVSYVFINFDIIFKIIFFRYNSNWF